MFKKREESRYDLDYVANLYDNLKGRFNVVFKRSGAGLNTIADSNIFHGNVITISNYSQPNIKSKINLNINLEIFIRNNGDKTFDDLSNLLLLKVNNFINVTNDDYSIILSTEDYNFDSNKNLAEVSFFLIKKFECFMINKVIKNNKKKFLINQTIDEKNIFVKNGSSDVLMFLDSENTFMHVNIDYKSFSEKLYSIFMDRKFIPSILFNGDKKFDYRGTLDFHNFAFKFNQIFYNHQFGGEMRGFSVEHIYYFEHDKLVLFERDPLKKMLLLNAL